MITWLLSLFAWRDVKYGGVWVYEENRVTGMRRVTRVCSGGYSPIDQDWLAGKLAAGGMRNVGS